MIREIAVQSTSYRAGVPLLLLAGPTASGKTALAVEMCRRLDGEIVSADSMQIYRHCDIVTAKPSPEEQAQARHHLLDICEPTERFSAAHWAAAARTAIEEIRQRGKQPIITGGTGFYIRALLEPEVLSPVPPDERLRLQLERELEVHGKDTMWQRLQEHAPGAAARLHRNDTYRVLRALQIALSTETPETLLRQTPATDYAVLAFALEWPREVLYARIEQRIDTMIAAGAREELAGLLNAGVPRDAPALGGVGYKQMLPALDAPDVWPTCVETWKRDTRRYAKRQMTWFRHQLPVEWLPTDESSSIAQLAGTVAKRWSEFLSQAAV
jgi:tRNA dimethylallyltransferase